MAQQNIEVVGRFNELLWGHRDIDAALRLVDGDAEFDWSNSRAPYSGLYRGHAAVREAWETATDAWDEFHLDFKEAIEVDRETIVVVTSVRARGKGSGVSRSRGGRKRVEGARGKDRSRQALPVKGRGARGCRPRYLTGMPQRNVEIVQRFYDAWSNDDFPGPLELMDPQIEYVNPAGAIEPGTRRGVPAFREAVEKLLESWEFWRAEPEELKASGDQVAAVVRYRTRGRGSGVEVEGRESALWTLRDGKVIRYQWFHGPTEALEAAEQSEQDARADST